MESNGYDPESDFIDFFENNSRIEFTGFKKGEDDFVGEFE